MRNINLLLYLIFISFTLHSQSYISAHINANYWYHTELIGYGGGIGFSQKIKSSSLNLNVSYGYGEYNRYKQLKNIDYNSETTVVINKGKWVTDLGAGGGHNRPQNTDNARNIQLNLNYKFPLYKKLNIAIGAYSAYVEHAYTFKSTKVFNIYAFPLVGSSYNLIQISEQNFITIGVNTELSLDLTKGNKIYSPFIDIGIGPHYSSYYSLGLRLSTQLLKK